MNILVIGSGGREHALCWKIRQSSLLKKLYCSPGNAGIADVAECVALGSDYEIKDFCKTNEINLVLIGPEGPLVEGLADSLREAGIAVCGPSEKAAQLEGSKGFMKDLCAKYNIPTAAYKRFTDANEACNYIREKGAPIVVKADGLAAGKGVIVAMEQTDALSAADDIINGERFGEAGKSIVVEEYLEGEEVSFFALCDGDTALPFGAAQDHKRVGDGDTGPNTGGMGTYSPAPIFTAAMEKRVMDEIVLPTINAMKKEGMPFQGVLFAGLMITKTGPKLIEYNVRFGDPETQSLMLRLKSDIIPLLTASAIGGLNKMKVEMDDERAAVCVVIANKGYPESYQKGSIIRGLNLAVAQPNVCVFHAGTGRKDNEIIATGGRVLGITAWAKDVAQARDKAYEAVKLIDWPEGFCRTDIGWRAIK